mmetsp:Transcript_118163/g.335180  ORF Transcript_118163/g.335180 Transcript_118163/m.335180 type:complete len:200 (+) Transcript_118163:114-713(+)
MISAIFLTRKDGGRRWIDCSACTGIDASEWLLCLGDDMHSSAPKQAKHRRRAKDRAGEVWDEVGVLRLEELTKDLFKLHDLNGNGLLEETELVKLNEQIAFLHHGPDMDVTEVRSKYIAVFRSKLDSEGRAVPYDTFRKYTREVLDGLDRDPEAQEMILEQFVAEARSARQAFDPPASPSEPGHAEVGCHRTMPCIILC